MRAKRVNSGHSIFLQLSTQVWKTLQYQSNRIELNPPVDNEVHINKENLEEILEQSPHLKEKWKELESTYPLTEESTILFYGDLEAKFYKAAIYAAKRYWSERKKS